ncbi:MAG: antitoxin [Jatrophihabitans sp.]
MRTTIDFPDDLLAQLRAIARSNGQTLSALIAELMRRELDPPEPATITKGRRSGFPMLAAVGRTITTEDVLSLEDDE